MTHHFMHMLDIPPALSHWLQHYGGCALFVSLALGILGLPVPDETLMTLAGILMAKGTWPMTSTLLAVFLGNLCGISMSYGLGRTAGHYLIKKYGPWIGITAARLERVHQWFERIGKWTLFIGYFIPGVRHLTGYTAGTLELSYHEFALFAYTGALVWSTTFMSLGYFLT